jgi:hypothetical protein
MESTSCVQAPCPLVSPTCDNCCCTAGRTVSTSLFCGGGHASHALWDCQWSLLVWPERSAAYPGLSWDWCGSGALTQRVCRTSGAGCPHAYCTHTPFPHVRSLEVLARHSNQVACTEAFLLCHSSIDEVARSKKGRSFLLPHCFVPQALLDEDEIHVHSTSLQSQCVLSRQ